MHLSLVTVLIKQPHFLQPPMMRELIAQTLQAAGFDVVGARDLDQDSLRRSFRDFLDKATASGPNTVAFVYLSGYGLQLEGENYFVPIDAKIQNAADVPAEAIRISDYIRPLAALKLKANIVVFDAARANPFARSGPPLAGGLALVEAEQGSLIAFNAAPGTVASEGQGPYGAYAQALAEMMRDGGLSLNDVFDRTRLRVNEMTKGAQVPWDASKVEASFRFFERAPDAPPPQVSAEQTEEIRSKPIRDFGAEDAYVAALERDTLRGYLDFLAAYPHDRMAKRVRAIVAARREAITWRRTRSVDSPRAYWSYLRRYPRGPHAYDARRRLEYLAAALEPPPSFDMIEYDVPPPPEEEVIYVDRPVLYFDDPDFDFAPPPPPPVIFLPPPPPEFVVLPPPPPPIVAFVLPIPVYRPVPVWVRPPAYVAPPPNNVIFNNIHNTVVINNTTNTVTVTNPSGQTKTLSPPAQAVGPTAGAPGGAKLVPTAAVVGPALPPSVKQKAIQIQNQTPQHPGVQPNISGQPKPQLGTKATPPGPPAQPLVGRPLPGANGRPLPRVNGVPATGHALPTQPVPQAPTQFQKRSPNLPPTKGSTKVVPASPLTPKKPPALIGNQPPPPSRTIKRPLPPAPAIKRPPPPAPVIKRPPPASVIRRPPPPASVIRRPPPPAPVIRRPPPPAPVIKRSPPPAPVIRRPPPPPAARMQPPASKPVSCPAGTRLVNGKCAR